ncbi:hypothetical protein Tco_0978382 [Tanacetum coccineum]|uniref:Uncharacterized protein n=1 Tax=Tanacetum coccineum TaxID=301880 RepID=A0ABQ5EMW6_9ASTR
MSALIAECLEKDICLLCLFDIVCASPSSNCLLRRSVGSALADGKQTIVLELEVKFLKQQKMVIDYEKTFHEGRLCELSKANTHSRTAYTEKLSALTSENTKLKALVHGKTRSGPSTSEKPKVLASGMYTKSSKYIPSPKRANWVKPTPLPKKKQVTLQTKPAKNLANLCPKSHTRNHHILPSKSVNARRAADHNRKLNVVDHNQFVIRSLKSVNTKTPQAKHMLTSGTNLDRHFALYDNCPLTRIMEPIVEPLELTPSVSSSSKVTMISRSKGRTVADSIAERLTRPTAYKFKTDCNIIPVWWNMKQGDKGHGDLLLIRKQPKDVHHPVRHVQPHVPNSEPVVAPVQCSG